MTAAKLDPLLCRSIAALALESATTDPSGRWHPDTLRSAAAQLTAAADIAERALTEERAREVVKAAAADEIDAYFGPKDRLSLARLASDIATRAAKELAGAAVGLNAEERDTLAAHLAWLKERHSGTMAGTIHETIAVLLDRLLGVTPTAQLKPATASIGPGDAAIIDEALDYYDRTGICPPHADIARIRALIASPGGGS